ncbi:hypothetical protein CAPTEDRAFT_216314 [Capitella teleta]|uniref:Uncharacterized protein n=1 Tax=Capitella teleta TaxID=283909 RepID=R7T5F4_CAPTE|nr:hypothetical protein CAPTEDRAFT_216314 [Capitella teleta]|eukprot:ELT88241.1 hypothetical protein CAPTEDRAFT_216314 [Capitella teleta]
MVVTVSMAIRIIRVIMVIRDILVIRVIVVIMVIMVIRDILVIRVIVSDITVWHADLKRHFPFEVTSAIIAYRVNDLQRHGERTSSVACKTEFCNYRMVICHKQAKWDDCSVRFSLEEKSKQYVISRLLQT